MGAIDFGIIVDATVIMVENIFRHLAVAEHGRSATAPRGRRPRLLRHDRMIYPRRRGRQGDLLLRHHHHRGLPAALHAVGVEGHIFGPMAKTYAYALSGGLLATFTISPALAALLREKVGDRDHLVRGLRRLYGASLVLARRCLTVRPARCSWRRLAWPRPRARVPAQARRGQHLGARRDAALGIARGGQPHVNRMRGVLWGSPRS